MELMPEERYTKRLELEKPVLDALLAWANEASAKTAPKSALGKLHYLRSSGLPGTLSGGRQAGTLQQPS